MTLTDRIALAEKLGYWDEMAGLMAASLGLKPRSDLEPIRWLDDRLYLRGYTEGLEILRVEGK